MTTGVFRGEIYMTPLHSPGPKIGDRCKQRAIIFYVDRVLLLCILHRPQCKFFF